MNGDLMGVHQPSGSVHGLQTTSRHGEKSGNSRFFSNTESCHDLRLIIDERWDLRWATEQGKPLASRPIKTMATPQERRQWTRYALRDARGKLSWGEGAEHSTCEMTVVNISGGGAAVLADLAPPADHTVWLRLESDFAETKPWEVRLVASSVDTSGKLFLRFRFVSWVPLDAVLERHQERRLWQRYPARETLRNPSLVRSGNRAHDPG